MFFRKLGLSGSCDWKQPPAYNQNDDLNHLPIVLDQRVSRGGPSANPLHGSTELNGSAQPVIALKNFKKYGISSFLYNAFDDSLNPVKKVHDSSALRVELTLDNERVYLPGLKEDLRSHTSLMDIRRSQGEEEELANYKASLTGRLVITVKSTSLVLQDLKLKLNGYSTEFVCVLEPAGGKRRSSEKNSDSEDSDNDLYYIQKRNDRTIRLLKDNSDGRFSYFKPFVTDEVVCFEKFPTILTKGTYILPFNFILDPLNYHSSLNSTVGATSYRVETLINILATNNTTTTTTTLVNNSNSGGSNSMPSSKFSEAIFLTHECYIIKTLSPTSLMKYESISTQGSYAAVMDYDFFISSKLIELNCPFHCQINFLAKESALVTKIDVSLVQMVLVPCLEPDCVKPLKKSYIQTNTVHLGHYFPSKDEQSNVVSAKFENLMISTTGTKSSLMEKILPYYCEESRLELKKRNTNEKRFKLKITHYLRITASATSNGGGTCNSPNNGNRININFKVPVMVIDKNMGSSLHLPAYEPPTVSKSFPVSTGTEFDLTCNSLEINDLSISSSHSPPSYTSSCF
ncbi:unnamed protein product [Kluyveromyces dobzhanskii CBS 2104]|uniref:WGS project CCBQ000000000 data, contig 00009 n=1 Tax=Kluyveromyces dobzhanskii CBS 2104 TaxID=1427455 RepID=A0A0A8L4Z3_9SACH|nr:unnamed protein product [Kluyveromyces dobzhanskii CBS 2104]